jgi:hypothetical protein
MRDLKQQHASTWITLFLPNLFYLLAISLTYLFLTFSIFLLSLSLISSEHWHTLIIHFLSSLLLIPSVGGSKRQGGAGSPCGGCGCSRPSRHMTGGMQRHWRHPVREGCGGCWGAVDMPGQPSCRPRVWTPMEAPGRRGGAVETLGQPTCGPRWQQHIGMEGQKNVCAGDCMTWHFVAGAGLRRSGCAKAEVHNLMCCCMEWMMLTAPL